MHMTWIAALPMYNVTPALAAVWRDWLADVLRDVAAETRIVDAGDDLPALWRHPDLLLSQTCGYPLMYGLNSNVQLIATPHFDAPGCAGANYSSMLVAHADAPFDTLADCRGARAAYNQDDSNSGMNAFRHAVARLAHSDAYFSATLRTGSHLGSLRAVIENRADVAAIDCVTFAFAGDELPELMRQVKTIGMTAASPGLPLIASKELPLATVDALRASLAESTRNNPERAKRLRLKGFSHLTLADYERIPQLEHDAQAAGYARLA
jgi:ABC-type phosphate/phosphonate transport system substrate-binding protein